VGARVVERVNPEEAAGEEVTVAGDRASPDSRGSVSQRRWFQRFTFGTPC
jgi:hypothetical protein